MRLRIATLALAAATAACQAAQPALPRPAGALHRAAADGRVAEVQRLLAQGAAVDERERDGSEWTPLHVASITGRADTAAALLERGADPNARARYDMTPLHWAALLGRAEVAGLLLRRGARVEARNLYGLTPLHEAADDRVVAVLADGGANVNAADDRGRTPLHLARGKRVARALLARGAELKRRGRDGRTPLEVGAFDALEPQGLSVQAARAGARLRGETATFELTVHNVSARPIQALALAADSPACAVTVRPAGVAALAPAQRATFALDLARRGGLPGGEHPLGVAVSAGGRALGTLALIVDTRAEETPEDRGMIRLGRGRLRPPPSWAQYVAYALVPLLLVGAWLWLRRRR
ncbi:MAG TPA: ankyrin repeat domain-containing protein [Polyangia bacterium]|jgi:ankyrin repeat protein